MKRQALAVVLLLAFLLIPPHQVNAGSSPESATLQLVPAFSISIIPSEKGSVDKGYRFLIFEPESIETVKPLLVQETAPQETQPPQAPPQEPVTQPQQPGEPAQPAQPEQPVQPAQPAPGQPVDDGVQPREGYPEEVHPEAERTYGWGYAWWWWIIIAGIIIFFIVIFAAWGGWGGGRGTRPPEGRM